MEKCCHPSHFFRHEKSTECRESACQELWNQGGLSIYSRLLFYFVILKRLLIVSVMIFYFNFYKTVNFSAKFFPFWNNLSLQEELCNKSFWNNLSLQEELCNKCVLTEPVDMCISELPSISVFIFTDYWNNGYCSSSKCWYWKYSYNSEK